MSDLRPTGGVELAELWAHRRANLEAKFAEKPARRPAWMDDEEALREEARLAADRIRQQDEDDDIHAANVALGFEEPRA